MIFILDDQAPRRQMIRNALNNLKVGMVEHEGHTGLATKVEALHQAGEFPRVFVIDLNLQAGWANGMVAISEIAAFCDKYHQAAFFILFSREPGANLQQYARGLERRRYSVMPISGEEQLPIVQRVVEQALKPLSSDGPVNDFAPLIPNLRGCERVFVFGSSDNRCHVYPGAGHDYLNQEFELGCKMPHGIQTGFPMMMYSGRWIVLAEATTVHLPRLLLRWRHLAQRAQFDRSISATAALGFDSDLPFTLRKEFPATGRGLDNFVKPLWKDAELNQFVETVTQRSLGSVLPKPQGRNTWKAKKSLLDEDGKLHKEWKLGSSWKLPVPPEFHDPKAPSFLKRMHFVFDEAELEVHSGWCESIDKVLEHLQQQR